MKPMLFGWLALLWASGVSAQTALDSALPAYTPSGSIRGSLTAAGDDDMEDLMRAWAAQFEKLQPGLELTLQVDSTATAAKALAGGVPLAFVGRKMLAPELAMVTSAWGYPPTAITVAGGTFDDRDETHAEAVWVNAQNPLRGLTLAQLDAIYGAERRSGAPEPIRTWGDLGLTGEWAGRAVHAFRHRSVGVTQFLSETVLQNGSWRTDMIIVDKPKAVMAAVAADLSAIGTAGLGFAPVPGTRLVPIARSGSGPWITPTLATVASRQYPLSRVIYFYINKRANVPLEPAAREFLRMVLSREGQEIALKQGFLPLPGTMVRDGLASLQE